MRDLASNSGIVLARWPSWARRSARLRRLYHATPSSASCGITDFTGLAGSITRMPRSASCRAVRPALARASENFRRLTEPVMTAGTSVCAARAGGDRLGRRLRWDRKAMQWTMD